MLRVRIAPLSDGLHTDALAPTPEDLDLDPAAFSELALDVRLDVAAQRVMLSYAVRAAIARVCDRSAEPFVERVEGRGTLVVVPPDAPLAAAAGDEGVLVVPEDEMTVDVTAHVRDTLLLAVPVRAVHPDFAEAEIPTRFGGPAAGEPADDRWDALRGLN